MAPHAWALFFPPVLMVVHLAQVSLYFSWFKPAPLPPKALKAPHLTYKW